MELSVTRDLYDDLATQGELRVGTQFICYTLEPKQDQSKGKPYCIPEGRYQLVLRTSPHFGFPTPHILNVPGFEDIEIHPGNYPCDTHGCTLLGLTRTGDFIGSSRLAFHYLMGVITTTKPEEEIWITYQKESDAV